MATKYSFIEHRETGEKAFMIDEGKFKGVIYAYENISVPKIEDLESTGEVPVSFKYNILRNSTDWDLEDNKEFGNVIGEIMMEVLAEAMENDRVNYENRNDNTEQPDS